MAIPFLIFLAAIGAIVVFVIVSYNRLVSLTQRSQSSWSDVDVQLKRRTDLVPNRGGRRWRRRHPSRARKAKRS